MVSLFSILITIFIGSSLVSILILLSHVPLFKDTWVVTLRNHILATIDKVPEYYDWVNGRYFKGKLGIYSQRLIPLFYFCLITFCLGQFFTKSVHILPEHIKKSYIHLFFIITIILSTYYTFFKAVFSDPGIIRPSNVSNYSAMFKPNGLIFFHDKVCPTCNFVKPARSKHCSICNNCIALYDHHCHWVNNCVGYFNYKYFISYLFSNIAFLVYGGYLCMSGLREVKKPQESYWLLVCGTDETNKVTGIFFVLCVIFSLTVMAFTSMHIRYLYLGVNTNESVKWSEIEHLVHLGLLYEVEDTTSILDKYVERASVDNVPVYISLKDEAILFTEGDGNRSNLKQVTSIENELINIYDQGFLQNVKERIMT